MSWGPVAVVDVPVDDQDPLRQAEGEGMGRRHGDVVEQAEAHGAIRRRMVTRRADQGQPPATFLEDPLDEGQPAARRMLGGVDGAGGERGIGVEVGGLPAQGEHRVDVRGEMHPLELRTRRRAPRQGAGAREQLAPVELLEDRPQPDR